MENKEYENLYKAEKEHWFYSGKREITHFWISKYVSLNKNSFHADIGTGSGIFVREMASKCFSTGIEFSDFSINNFKQKDISIIRSSISDLPLKKGIFDCTTSLDVLEHIEDDKKALKELIRITKTDGIIIINVPAFHILWSEWDVALHHKRRYTKKSFQNIIDTNLVLVEKMFYINNLIFFPVIIYRLLRNIFRLNARLEDNMPAPFINKILKKLFVIPAKWLYFHFPFGVSLFVILRKKTI